MHWPDGGSTLRTVNAEIAPGPVPAVDVRVVIIMGVAGSRLLL